MEQWFNLSQRDREIEPFHCTNSIRDEGIVHCIKFGRSVNVYLLIFHIFPLIDHVHPGIVSYNLIILGDAENSAFAGAQICLLLSTINSITNLHWFTRKDVTDIPSTSSSFSDRFFCILSFTHFDELEIIFSSNVRHFLFVSWTCFSSNINPTCSTSLIYIFSLIRIIVRIHLRLLFKIISQVVLSYKSYNNKKLLNINSVMLTYIFTWIL